MKILIVRLFLLNIFYTANTKKEKKKVIIYVVILRKNIYQIFRNMLGSSSDTLALFFIHG